MDEQLEDVLAVHFQDRQLLQLALTHRSYIYETAGAGQSSNERMEFLGDYSRLDQRRLSLSYLPTTH